MTYKAVRNFFFVLTNRNEWVRILFVVQKTKQLVSLHKELHP